MYRKNKLYEAVTLAIASGSIGISGSASAQEEGSRRLEEIVVTAAKREENLQDVPIAVQAMDAGMIEDFGIENFEDLRERDVLECYQMESVAATL